MKRKPIILCMLAATVLGSGLATASVVLAQEPVGTASGRITDSESNTKDTVEAITQQIAKLEVERALQETRLTPDSPVIRAIDSQLRSLQQRLVQIQPDGNKTVASTISEAIRAKIAELEIERDRQEIRYSPDNPIIQLIDAQLQSLGKRLAQIQQSAS